jgi:hypothetical protein
MTRRFVAIGVVAIVLLAMALLLRSCVNSSRVNGLKNYNTEVNSLGTASISNVTSAFDILTKSSSQEAIDQSQSLSQLARDSDKLTERARKLSTPGGLEAATQNVATALSLRATALERIGQLIGKARGTSASEQETATAQIAGQMEALLAADVLWKARVTPFISEQYKARELNDDSVAPSVAVKTISWLNTATVARILGSVAADNTADDPSATAAPGTHGHAVESVSVNNKALVDGGVTTVPNASGTSFTVTIANQGENNETNVNVVVSGKPRAGGTGFNQTKKITSSLKNTTTPITIPLTKAITGSYTITVEVKKVLGEVNTDNNKKTYNVIFQ